MARDARPTPAIHPALDAALQHPDSRRSIAAGCLDKWAVIEGGPVSADDMPRHHLRAAARGHIRSLVKIDHDFDQRQGRLLSASYCRQDQRAFRSRLNPPLAQSGGLAEVTPDKRNPMSDQKHGGRAAARVEEAQAAFTSNYQAYQYRFVEFFIEHLSDVSRSFQGDLQSMIVLALVGQVQMRAMRSAIEAGRDPRDLPAERVSISASRIADVTSIPRETVRRKLDGLERRGWILRNPDGSWRLAVADGEAAARTDLSDLDARAIGRVARLFRDLEFLVAAHRPF
jgi:hypothetical protein